MSVLIKDIEMPVIELDWTIRRGADGKWYAIDTNAETSDGEWHEIIPVPPHGRLIDADALMELIKAHDYPLRAHFNSTDNGMFTIGIQQAVDELPTIIPAEP